MTAPVMAGPPALLMVAYHFPPFKGSSGLERTLGFCRHLPSLGWRPIVLSAAPRAYASTSNERLGDVPPEVEVFRSFALDVTRQLAVGGRYPGWLALPDRWSSWALGAVPRGLSLVRRHRPSALWSTYPIATAHIVGAALQRLTGVPWVADFRDPMVEFNHRKQGFAPADPALRNSRLWVERLCARYATKVVFCTATAARIFTERYPEFPAERAVVIANGFDERTFSQVDPADRRRDPRDGGRRITLLHSGVLYPGPDRDPRPFFQALRQFLDSDPSWYGRVQVVLRATGHDALYSSAITQSGLQGVVSLEPMIPYRDAVREMLEADGLLVFQGYTSNPAIPAKVYEYLRARRPILGLVDSEGETAQLLRSQDVGTLLPIDDVPAMMAGLDGFLKSVEQRTARVLLPEQAELFERRHRAVELARLLDEVRSQAA